MMLLLKICSLLGMFYMLLFHGVVCKPMCLTIAGYWLVDEP